MKTKTMALTLIVAVLAMASVLVYSPGLDAEGTDDAVVEGQEEVPTNVAKIGDVEYGTLAEAVSAVKSGETIELIADVETGTVTFTKNGDYVLDIGTHTVTQTNTGYLIAVGGSEAPKYPFDTINDGVQLTIIGTGTIDAKSTTFRSYGKIVFGADGVGPTVNMSNEKDTHSIFKVEEGSYLTVNGGTFTVGGAVDRVMQSFGTTIINGGTFNGNIEAWKYSDYVSTITVGPDAVINGSFAIYPYEDEVITSNDGFTGLVAKNGIYWYHTLATAVAAAGENDTITLLADVNETAAIQVTKDVTIDLDGKSLAAKFDIVSEGDVAPTIAFKGDLSKADVQVNGSTTITFGTLKLTVPTGKAFAADGKAITVSEASLEGTVLEGFDLIVTSKATIPAGKTVEGAIWFDTAKNNGIALSSVKAGTSGVTLTKGSVEIVGDFTSSEDGTITVTGVARIVGDSTIDGIKLVIPKGASLTVEEGASVTGTGSISNAGTVKVLGDLATALDNTSDAVVQVSLTGSIDTDKVTGDGKVSFDSIILRDIGTKYYRVGDKVDIPVTVDPATATLTIDYTVSPSWLTIRDGHIVGIVAQEGSFNVTVKASMEDRETVSESFVINAVPGVDPDEPQGHEFTFKEIVKIAVIILVVLMVICLVTRAFIG